MDIVIRRATAVDVPAIQEIYNDAVRRTIASADYDPQPLKARLIWFQEHEREGYPVFVAEQADETIVGWSSLSKYRERIGYRFTAEDSIYIAERLRGQGIGKLLMQPVVDAAEQMGLHAVLAVIAGHNEPSLRLHTSFGFEQVGLLKQVIFKFGEWIDVAILEKMIDPPQRVQLSS